MEEKKRKRGTLAPLALPDNFSCSGCCSLQWNLDLTKGQGTGKMCSLYICNEVLIVISRFFHIFYYY